MSYYHVYIRYTDKGTEQTLVAYDIPEGFLRKTIVNPFMENRRFLCIGIILHPSRITRIAIFHSEKKYGEHILPNGMRCVDSSDQDYIVYCFYNGWVEGVLPVTQYFITSLPQGKEELTKIAIEPFGKKGKMSELTIGLMKSVAFLGLDANWSLATCALQLQEVAMTLVAKREKVRLDKANVERTLNKKIQSLSFNDQYGAFTTHVKALFGVEMPILTTHLRKMRTKVLHEGYNPKPEETDSIVTFTIGLLKKLEKIV